MIDELLTYVRDNGLSNVFNYNRPMGNEPYEIGIRKMKDGKWMVLVNGNGDYGREVELFGVSEERACEECYKWLEIHMKNKGSFGRR